MHWLFVKVNPLEQEAILSTLLFVAATAAVKVVLLIEQIEVLHPILLPLVNPMS